MGVIAARRRILMNTPHLESATGNPLTFSKGEAAPLKKCVVNFAPVQAGSGDPSPTNVRPITGWTGVNVSHSGADTSDPTVLLIHFPIEAGTVYGGYVDLANGILTKTCAKYVFNGSEDWRRIGDAWNKDNTGFTIVADGLKTSPDIISCDTFKIISGIGIPEHGSIYNSTSSFFNLRVRTVQSYTVNEFKAYLSEHNITLIALLATPERYNLIKTPIKSKSGTNNIWSDANGNIELSYWTH